MIATLGSFGNSFLRCRVGRVEQLLNQYGQRLQGAGLQYGCGCGVGIDGAPVCPVGGDGKRPLRRALKNQGLLTRDLSSLQDQEMLLAERVKRMRDADISRRLVGGQCIAQ